MGLFEWGEKRFASGITKAMIRSYNLYKNFDPSLSEFELVKRTLLDRPGYPAETLLTSIEDEDFYKSIGGGLSEIIYVLVRMEYAEYMKGSLEKENLETNYIFKNVIVEEMKKKFKEKETTNLS